MCLATSGHNMLLSRCRYFADSYLRQLLLEELFFLLSMSNRRNFIILIVLWGVLATGLSLYLWIENQRIKEVDDTLSKSNEVLKKLVANEYKSYTVINDCFVVQKGLCNPEDFKGRLQVLGDEADELYDQLTAFNQQLQTLKVSR